MTRSYQAAIGFAIEAAEGFRLAGLRSAPKRNAQQSASPIAALTSSAVNLSLSLELFFKALILLSRIVPPRTHNLKDLFDQLPRETRSSIETLYGQFLDADPEEESDLTIMSFHYSADPQELLGRNFRADTANPDLETLLESHENTFMLWRYIHEIQDSMRSGYSYDFRSMNAAIKAASIHANEVARHFGLLITMQEGAPPENWGLEGHDDAS